MTYRKKLIEVAMPLRDINAASAREKSIRHGHPSTLHLWWARRPLAAARAVLFGQLVDDPSSDPDLNKYQGEVREGLIGEARAELFALIEQLVKWENTNEEKVLNPARAEIARSIAQDKLDSGEMEKDTPFFDEPPQTQRGFGDESKTVLYDLRRRAAKPEAVRHFLAEYAPAFHDPFAGGGAIPLEAQRLGLKSYASDLNPVAVLINKAMIEIPPKFAGMPPVNPEAQKGRRASSAPDSSAARMAAIHAKEWKGAQGLAEDVRYYGQWMRDEAEKRIGHLYPKIEVTPEMVAGSEGAPARPDLEPYEGRKLTVIAWLWARTVKSPNPAYSHVDVPLASTFMLSTKKGKEAYVEPVIDGDKYRFTVKTGRPKNFDEVKAGTKLGRGSNFRCLLSGAPISGDYIKEEGKAGRMGARLMAIVAEGNRSRVYIAPTPEHQEIAGQAEPTWRPEGQIARRMSGGNCTPYGLTEWGDLFTPRQLVALTTFSDLVQETREKVRQDAERLADRSQETEDRGLDALSDLSAANYPLSPSLAPQAYADAVAVYLGMSISKMSDAQSSLCRWKTTMDQSIATFGRQALPMVWDYSEANALGGMAGDPLVSLKNMMRVLRKLDSQSASHVAQADAQSQAGMTASIVSTDPPYYDNIGYADLSDFFYVWLRRSLQPVFPTLFATVAVPKAEELVATPYRHGSKEKAENFFLDGMTRAMHRLAEQADRSAPVTIYYAFKQAETKGDAGTASTGWETFIDAVIRAGFGISGTWPMRTELGNRMIGSGTNALASSIVLVCRPRPEDAPSTTRGAFVRALQKEMPEALKQMQLANIAPVDLPQSCIGPGMAIFTRYKNVLNQDDTPMKVREALQLINESIDNFFSEQEADYDADTRFALTWFDQHGFNDGPFGEADNLARARAVSVDGVVKAGILKSGQGKVRLLRRGELDKDWDPATDERVAVWEALQHLVQTLEDNGESATAELAGRLAPHQRTLARELAYRLYTTCERKKDATEARAYNALITSWPEIERLADKAGKPAPSQRELY